MKKGFYRLLIIVFLIAFTAPVFAQTITIHDFDAGTYGRGSSISVPVTIPYNLPLTQANTFQVFLSDAGGNFPGTQLPPVNDFYAAYINTTIPTGTPAGNGYKIRIVPTQIPSAAVETPAFTISAGTAVTAGMTVPEVVKIPDIVGICDGEKNGNYTFTNSSSAGTATISIFNETTKANITPPDATLNPTANFDPDNAIYTITVRAESNGIIGTFSYTLLNRVYNYAIGAGQSPTICQSDAGGVLTYPINVTSSTGLQNNYPGLLYKINWGDNTSSISTLFEIIEDANTVSHTYFASSCGRILSEDIKNAFQIDFSIQTTLCDLNRLPSTTYAKVVAAPFNRIDEDSPKSACAGNNVSFANASYTGQDPESNEATCENTRALYTWKVYLIGNSTPITIMTGYIRSQNFDYVFPAAGNYRITVEIENPDGKKCSSDPGKAEICVRNKPVANFDLPLTACLSNPVSPTDRSVVDETSCSAFPSTYRWTITPATGRTISDPNTRNPTFNFTEAGVYTITLRTNGSCISEASKSIRVDDRPTVSLSPNTPLCGIGTPRTFGETPGPTQTIITGTAVEESPNYEWTVSGGRYEFVAPTNRNSRYPTIIFRDEAEYTVTVTHSNNCSPAAFATQKLDVKDAPQPNPGTYPAQCPNTSIQLNAQQPPAGSGAISVEWTGPGTFSPNRFVLNPTYLPTDAERDAGLASVVFIIHTNISGCRDISSGPVDIVIKPLNRITSLPTRSICNDARVNYSPIAAPGSTFRWSIPNPPVNAVITPGPASGPTVLDQISNISSGQDIEVEYLIIPTTADGCDGETFPLKVIVSPKTITADFTVSQSGPYCGSTLLTFTAASQSASSTFTWTVSDGSGFTGPVFTRAFDPIDDGSGREKPYTVTLTVTNACAIIPPSSTNLLINPATPVPIASAEADGDCGSVNIVAQNLSPGENVNYIFTLLDAQNNEVQPSQTMTTKDPVTFTGVQPPATGTANVRVRLVVEDKCGNFATTTSPDIILTPNNLVSDMTVDRSEVCLGDEVIFNNNSTGTSFEYKVYAQGAATPITTLPFDNRDAIKFKFPAPGTYQISITPRTGCGLGTESAKKAIVVYGIPNTDFTQAVVNCNNLTYQFTPAVPVNSTYNYTWDFGDGTGATDPTPAHAYASSGVYSVSLTVNNIQNTLSCIAPATIKPIAVSPPLVANFTVLPGDTILIPDYHFSFRDASIGGPVSWAWDFDDKDGTPPSPLQNPEFTYTTIDTGYHNITLTITDNNGCPKTITKVIKITGTPGQLFVPNAFVPTSTSTAVQTFMAKGKGVKTWKMQIYNKWGQLMWQTDKLGADGEPIDGWDGNYQGSPAPQGAYLWQIEATFINGTRWKGMSYRNSTPKRTGVINLIR